MLTLEILKNYHLKETAHLNFGGGSYGYDYACQEEPRLRRSLRSMKKRGRQPASLTDHYLVDGHPVLTLAEVVDLLNAPPREPPAEFAAREAALAEVRERITEKGKTRHDAL